MHSVDGQHRNLPLAVYRNHKKPSTLFQEGGHVMTDMPQKNCACATPMDNVHGVWICAHCDTGCTADRPCGLCNKYSAQTQLRINNTARLEKPDTKPPATDA